jgi:hypothetical protein
MHLLVLLHKFFINTWTRVTFSLTLVSSLLIIFYIFPLATVLKARFFELRVRGHFTPWY